MIEVLRPQIRAVVQLGRTFPVPLFNIGPDDLFPPLGDILQERLAGTDHRSADRLDVLPFHTEHIRPAAFGIGIKSGAFKDKTTGDIIGNDTGRKDRGVHSLHSLPPRLTGEHRYAVIMLVQGIPERLCHAAKCARLLNEFQLLGIKLRDHAVYPRFLKTDLRLIRLKNCIHLLLYYTK